MAIVDGPDGVKIGAKGAVSIPIACQSHGGKFAVVAIPIGEIVPAVRRDFDARRGLESVVRLTPQSGRAGVTGYEILSAMK